MAKVGLTVAEIANQVLHLDSLFPEPEDQQFLQTLSQEELRGKDANPVLRSAGLFRFVIEHSVRLHYKLSDHLAYLIYLWSDTEEHALCYLAVCTLVEPVDGELLVTRFLEVVNGNRVIPRIMTAYASPDVMRVLRDPRSWGV